MGKEPRRSNSTKLFKHRHTLSKDEKSRRKGPRPETFPGRSRKSAWKRRQGRKPAAVVGDSIAVEPGELGRSDWRMSKKRESNGTGELKRSLPGQGDVTLSDQRNAHPEEKDEKVNGSPAEKLVPTFSCKAGEWMKSA